MPLNTVGLGGDGDEVAAITGAFACFGAIPPIDDAAGWLTVGDVWISLKRLRPEAKFQAGAWKKFVEALCEETGPDPDRVTMDTRLLV